MKLKFLYALIFSASMLMAGCDELGIDDGVEDPFVEDPSVETLPPTGIFLNETEITLSLNDIYTLTATLTPSDATGSIEWESSDSNVALVSSGGAVLANAIGTANITATCETFTATCVVTVELGSGDDIGSGDDSDNLFISAFGYGPNGESAQEGADGSETAYSLTNSSVQTNAWDVQFCISFGYDNDSDETIDQGIVVGQRYKVSMSVKSDGESIWLQPSVNNEGNYLATLSSGQSTTSEWQDFIFEFTGDSSIENGNRLTFSIGDKISTLYVDKITILEVSDSDGDAQEGEDGTELFTNGDLESDFNTLTGWTWGAECSLGYTDDGGYKGSRGYFFTNGVVRDENWQGQIQIKYDSSTIREPEGDATDSYVFSIKARADSNTTVPAPQSTDDASFWTAFVDAELEVTTEWQTFEMPFTVSAGSNHIGTTQINFNCGQLGTTLYLDDISLIRKE